MCFYDRPPKKEKLIFFFGLNFRKFGTPKAAGGHTALTLAVRHMHAWYSVCTRLTRHSLACTLPPFQ